VPYLSACSRQGAIQIHVYLTLPYRLSIFIHITPAESWRCKGRSNRYRKWHL